MKSSEADFCIFFLPTRQIFSFNQNSANAQTILMELWQFGTLISSVPLKFFQIGDRKQGYSATVVPGLDHQYRLSMAGGGKVSSDWIIEFSDPTFGNRWKRDEIDLVVTGRNCPYPVHSQHDRRYCFCTLFFCEDVVRLKVHLVRRQLPYSERKRRLHSLSKHVSRRLQIANEIEQR